MPFNVAAVRVDRPLDLLFAPTGIFVSKSSTLSYAGAAHGCPFIAKHGNRICRGAILFANIAAEITFATQYDEAIFLK